MRSFFLLVALMLLSCLAGCDPNPSIVLENPEFVSSYHVKLVVKGELVQEWHTKGPVWNNSGWNCCFIEKGSCNLVQLIAREMPTDTPLSEYPEPIVIVTSMDKVENEPRQRTGQRWGW